MNLIEILLPLYAANGQPIPRSHYDNLSHELTERFGGVTLYKRAPASGFWKEQGEEIVKDDIVIFEVMARELDRRYWQHQKLQLQYIFNQKEIIIRVSEVTLI